MKIVSLYSLSFAGRNLKSTCLLFLILIFSNILTAQDCPVNIDFEKGNFDGWTCYDGSVSDGGGVNVFSLFETGGPMNDKHTIIPANSGVDPFGGFSMSSPNNSAYSIRLGNASGGGQAEAISYEFTIPAGRDKYSLLYYYAVVFEDPNHNSYEQPRMEIEITNVSDASIIECASFSFIPFGTGLPGFFQSPATQSNAPVWCKDWTPVSINLDNMAGKTIKLLFRTGDCTFRRHFGYAYIDVDTDCSGEFVGASFCPEDPFVDVTAPFGFQNYTWFDQNMTRALGTGQVLRFQPAPPSGTIVNVQLVPFPGFGCTQTMAARLVDNLSTPVNAGPNLISCNDEPVRMENEVINGLRYLWSPAIGLSNIAAPRPVANPPSTTKYYVTARSPGGGCNSIDSVIVFVSDLDDEVSLIGQSDICIGSNDSAVLQVSPAFSIQWLKDGNLMPGEENTTLKILETGNYAALLIDTLGCNLTTIAEPINISSIPLAAIAVDNAAQCLLGNSFVFTNNSTATIGNMEYRWEPGSNAIFNTRDLTYTYPQAGFFSAKMVVRTNSVCADSAIIPITVYPNAVAAFSADAICINLPFVPVNQTDTALGSPINYTWVLPNGRISNERDPEPQTFAATGTHTISLSVNTDQCPTPLNTLTRTLTVEAPVPGIRYPTTFVVIDVPFILRAREVGDSVRWIPDRFLSAADVFNPTFDGARDQDYTIYITTTGGCEIRDSLLVQAVRDAAIYVPSGFTPNNDGKNDILRPALLGIKELVYFRVFNRWGQMVFESTTPEEGWDGRINGIPQATQSVVWMVEGIGLDGKKVSKKGTTMLIR